MGCGGSVAAGPAQEDDGGQSGINWEPVLLVAAPEPNIHPKTLINVVKPAHIPAELELAIGTPRIVFEGSYVSFPGGGNSYDVSPDARRFLMVRREQKTIPTRIHVVLNWFEDLKRLVPTN